jgi:glycerol-3-phosphate O-acyltransferase
VDSYIKGFDYMLFIGIAGNILRVNKKAMSKDRPSSDVVVHAIQPPINCQEFRNSIRQSIAGKDPIGNMKQEVAYTVEKELEKAHIQASTLRDAILDELKAQGIKPVKLNVNI